MERGIKRRHLVAGLATAAAMALLLSGCSGSAGENASTENVEISFLTHWGPDQVKQLNDAAAAFKKEHPNVTVKVQAVPFGNLLSTLRTQGSSPNGPTIASIYDLWLPELIRDGIAAKAPESVQADVSSNWPASLVESDSADGSLYGIPNEIDLYQLNYNKKLFADAGVSAPPTTFDELAADAKKLTNKAAGVQGLGVITNWASGAVHPFLSLAASNNGYLLNDDHNKAALTSPNVQAVADLYAQLIKDGSVDASMSAANANTTGPYLDNFVNGKTAMIIMANWWESALKDSMGDNFKNVATAPIPVGPDGDKSSSISYSWLTIVNAKANDAKQKAAWDFLSFLNGPESGKAGSSAMGDILIGMGILPSRNSDIEAHSSELSDPFLKSYVDELSNATPFPLFIGGDAASSALQKHVEALIFGQESPGDAMEKAAAEVDGAIAAGK